MAGKGKKAPGGDPARTSRSQHSGRRHRRTIARTAIVLAVLAVAAAGSAAWLAHRATEVQGELTAARALVPQFQQQLAGNDNDGAGETLEQLQSHTAAAREAATDPLWKAAGALPLWGNNFAAVTEMAVSADDLVSRAAEPMLRAASSIKWESLTPANGKVDAAALESASPVVASAANTVSLTYLRLADVDRSHLVPEVARPLEEATQMLDELRHALKAAAAASEILPSMLGTESPRNYLVLVQNNAEVRATGGLPGALAVLHTDGGKISLTAQASGSSLGPFTPPIETDPEQVRIYTDRLGMYISDVNLTPDFPTVARTAKAMWEQRHGTRIDGVLALDPVVLSHILEASGPIPAPAAPAEPGTENALPNKLKAGNVVRTLLSGVYLNIDANADQDEYFTSVSQEIFSTVTSGAVPGAGLLDALATSLKEGRLYLWSNDRDEQKVLGSMALGGAIAGPGSGGAAFGTYFNDGTGAKMDYYVERTAQLSQTCGGGGYSAYTLTVTLKNTAPKDAATSLPQPVTGGQAFGTEPGHVKTNTVAYGPTQARVEAVRVNGEPVSAGSFQHSRRPVGMVTTTLAPKESVTVEFDFGNVVQESDPTLSVTPTVQNTEDVVLPMETSGC